MAIFHLNHLGPLGGDLQGQLPNPTLRDSISRIISAQMFASRAALSTSTSTTTSTSGSGYPAQLGYAGF